MQVTFIEALDQLMPGFDPEISKLAQRVLINPRKIDYHTGVFASKVSLLYHALQILLLFLYTVCPCIHLLNLNLFLFRLLRQGMGNQF